MRWLLLLPLVTGCASLFADTTPAREVCYEQARAAYWAGVEDCKARGLDSKACPLNELGAELQRNQEKCP